MVYNIPMKLLNVMSIQIAGVLFGVGLGMLSYGITTTQTQSWEAENRGKWVSH